MGTRRTWAVVVLLAPALGACRLTGGPDGGATRRLVVTFSPPFSDDQRRDVLTTCGALPQVKAEALGTRTAVARSEVSFDISGASDRQLADLYSCLDRLGTKDRIAGTRIDEPGMI